MKKYFTGSYLPTRDMDVQPSKFGIHQLIKFKFADQTNEIIMVMMGIKKQSKHKFLRLTVIDLL